MKRLKIASHPHYDLALSVFDYYTSSKSQRIRTGLNSALNALGFGKWIYPYGAYRDDDTTSGRNYILKMAENFPQAEELKSSLWKVWTGIVKVPEVEDVPEKTEYLKTFVQFYPDGTAFTWGLRDTEGMLPLFKAKYDKLVLKIRNGEDVIHSESFFPKLNEWEFEGDAGIEVLKGDHDVRIEVRYSHHNAWGSGGQYHDFAFINGVWMKLKFQGPMWDGAYNDPEKTPVEFSEDEEKFQDLIDDVQDWANEIQHGWNHVRKWTRVLRRLRGDKNATTDAEIRKMWDQHNRNKRWSRVVDILPYLYKREE